MTSYPYLMPAVRGRELPATPSGCPPPGCEFARMVRRAFVVRKSELFSRKQAALRRLTLPGQLSAEDLASAVSRFATANISAEKKESFALYVWIICRPPAVLSTNWRMLTTDFFTCGGKRKGACRSPSRLPLLPCFLFLGRVVVFLPLFHHLDEPLDDVRIVVGEERALLVVQRRHAP